MRRFLSSRPSQFFTSGGDGCEGSGSEGSGSEGLGGGGEGGGGEGLGGGGEGDVLTHEVPEPEEGRVGRAREASYAVRAGPVPCEPA